LESNILGNTKTFKAAVVKGLVIDFLGLPADWRYKSAAKEVLQGRYEVR
jgi:hypothetical protein